MQPDNQIRTKYCNNCRKRINFTHFDVHQVICKSKKETPVEPRRFRLKDYKSSTATQNQQLFPCHLCGFNQSLQQLDTHCKICPNRQVDCSFCSFSFPTKMMDDHLQVCPKKTIKTIRQSETQNNRLIKCSTKKNRFTEGDNNQVLLSSRKQKRSSIKYFDKEIQYADKYKKTEQKKKPQQYLEHIGATTRRKHLQRTSDIIYIDKLRKMRRIIHQLQQEGSSRIESLASRINDTQSEGLRKEEIRQIKEQHYKHQKDSELQDCSICYCVIVENHLVKDLPCNHLYHAECLSKWLAKNTACPMCKFDISTLLKPPSLNKTIHIKNLDQTKQTHFLPSDSEDYD